MITIPYNNVHAKIHSNYSPSLLLPSRSKPTPRTAVAHATPPSDLITLAEVQDIAIKRYVRMCGVRMCAFLSHRHLTTPSTTAIARGTSITVKTLGPVYRIVCRDGNESGPILGVTNGFLLPPPLGLMHCDTLQIFTKGQRGEQGDRTRGGILGLGLLIGGATFAFGWEHGCKKAEILAINDDGTFFFSSSSSVCLNSCSLYSYFTRSHACRYNA